MTKRLSDWQRDARVASLERCDGSVDEAYKYDLFLAEGWQVAGYGGRTKFCRNLVEVARFIKTAERCDK